jgi:hypothetical protein
MRQYELFRYYTEMLPCYAALEHKEFARDDQALITYSCNSFSPRKQLAEMDIYVPRAALVPLPKSEGR